GHTGDCSGCFKLRCRQIDPAARVTNVCVAAPRIDAANAALETALEADKLGRETGARPAYLRQVARPDHQAVFDRPPVGAPDIDTRAVPEASIDVCPIQEIERHGAFRRGASRREAGAGFERHRLEPGGWRVGYVVEDQVRVMVRGAEDCSIAPREAPAGA